MANGHVEQLAAGIPGGQQVMTGMLQLPDYLLIGAYICLVIGIGIFLKRSIKGAKDYFTAGAQMPWWVAGVSYFMASFSTMLFINYCEIAFKFGLVAFTITWVSGFSFLVGGIVMAHRWRRARVMTPMGFMERRYSKSIHQLFVWAGFPLRLADNGMRIYGIALVTIAAVKGVAFVKDVDKSGNYHVFIYAILILGSLFIIYSLLGGQSSVMITDFVQAMILLVTVCVITYCCMPQGWWQNLTSSKVVPAERLNWTQQPLQAGFDWTYMIGSIFLIGVLNNMAGWALVQKYNCVRSEKDARKMIGWVFFLKMISPPIFFLPGLAAYYILRDPQSAAATAEEITKSITQMMGGNTRYVFAVVSFKVLPVGLAGLMMLAMLGSAFSAMGSEYNTLSGVLTRDFYKRRLRPQASTTEEVFFGRCSVIVIGVITLLIGILYDHYRQMTLLDMMMRAFGAFGPPIMLPVVLGMLTKKFNSHGVWYGVVPAILIGTVLVGVDMWATDYFLVNAKDANGILILAPAVNEIRAYWLVTFFGSMIGIVTSIITIAGMYIGTALHPSTPEEKASVDEFFADLKRPYLIDRKAPAGISPFKLIGMLAFMFGIAMALVTIFVYMGRVKYNVQSFTLHWIVVAIMIGLGSLMWWRSGVPNPEVAEEENASIDAARK